MASLARPHMGTALVPVSGERPAYALRVLLVWLVLAVILIAVNWSGIVKVRFGDPDDALRLLQVRDLLAGQSWFDVHQYRVMAPQGVPMHWSRLVDIPLAGMILILRPLLGTANAEFVTVVMVPLLTLLCALMLVGRLAAKLFDSETVGVACLVTGIASPLLFQMTPLRIDHHGWQIVLALAALNGLCATDARKGGLAIGAALAALLAISIEGLPLTAVFLGACVLRDLREPHRRFAWFTAAATPLALAGAAIYLGTRGTYDLATHCDAVSPVHLGIFAWIAAGAWTLRLIGPRPIAVQLGLLAMIGAGAAAIMLGGAPQCKGGAFVALDPLVRRMWYAGVSEGLPFWRSPIAYAATTVCVPLIGLLAALDHARRAPSRERMWLWLDYAVVLAGSWAIGLLVARATATACGFAALPTAALVLRWIRALRTETRPARRMGGYLAIVLALMPSLPVVTWGRIHPASSNRIGVAMKFSQCRYDIAARALDRLPATDIFAPLDIGPDLLVRTPHRVIATGHHRASAGMHDVIAAFMGTPQEALPIIRAHHATLIAVCPDIAEPGIYARRAPQGLMAQLMQGKGPEWARPVDLAPGSHMKFWRVTD